MTTMRSISVSVLGLGLVLGQAARAVEKPDILPSMGDQWPDFRGPLGNFNALPCPTPLGCPYRTSKVAVMAAAFDPSPVRYMWPVIVDGRMIAHCSTRIVCWDLRLPTATK
jgi:hypothetical protein